MLQIMPMSIANLNLLEANSLVKMDDGFILQPTGIHAYSIRSLMHTHTCKKMIIIHCTFFQRLVG